MVYVIDNVLSETEFQDYLERLKFARFQDVVSQGQKYSDISQDLSGDKIYQKIEKELGIKAENVINFLRAYVDRPNYRHPMWIHSDVMFADYIGVYFAQSSEFPQDDGFALWRNKELDAIEITSRDPDARINHIVDKQSIDPEKWELWKRVEFKKNRIVICPASYFHSCATYANYGTRIDNCRIVHVLFFNARKNDP